MWQVPFHLDNVRDGCTTAIFDKRKIEHFTTLNLNGGGGDEIKVAKTKTKSVAMLSSPSYKRRGCGGVGTDPSHTPHSQAAPRPASGVYHSSVDLEIDIEMPETPAGRGRRAKANAAKNRLKAKFPNIETKDEADSNAQDKNEVRCMC
ncbi:unnamed protein product, partial [Candidula unifasciata]